MKKVLLSTRLPEECYAPLKGKFEVTVPEKQAFSREEILDNIHNYDAFLSTFQFKVDEEIIGQAAERVKIISNFGVGFNNIDVEAATRCGIVVTNTPDPVIEPTAEQAMALMLACARRIAEMDHKLRENNVKWGVMENLGISLNGKTLGIIGMGNIGQALARRAQASGMKIIYHNRKKLSADKEDLYQAQYYELDKLLENADVISIHTPLTPETKHLINSEKLSKMKSSAILINTARGPILDEEALADVLINKRIYAAGLDVFENEPKINPKLLSLDNVVLAPHNGTGTIEARIEIGHAASENIMRFFEGNTNITRVN